jgi:glutathione S-transferase
MPYMLYGNRRSGSCMVELALAEIGAPYEFNDIDLERDGQRDAAYAAVNPQRKLPALITPDGETLTESAAILLTLDERHPDANLMPPSGTRERAQALRWMLFVATEIYPIVEINDYPERFTSDQADSQSTREIARRIWRDRWLIVENHVAGDPFMLAQRFCLTDIYISVVSRWAQQDEWRPLHLPKVERLTAGVSQRSACAEVWARHFS